LETRAAENGGEEQRQGETAKDEGSRMKDEGEAIAAHAAVCGAGATAKVPPTGPGHFYLPGRTMRARPP